MTNIISNLAIIRNRIEQACQRAGRETSSVRLLLATKTVSADNIVVALQAGENLIGENKLQELEEKYELLKHVQHSTHFIGHLQTNKIKKVIRYADCIQSLDSVDLALKLHKQLLPENKTMKVLVQVNTSGEISKFGIDPGDAIAFVRQVAALPTLKIKGLMTIGLFSAETGKVRTCFRMLRDLQQKLIAEKIEGVEMNELSMGMSNDLEIAIEEGATIVRVGTAVFGKRIYADSYYWNESR